MHYVFIFPSRVSHRFSPEAGAVRRNKEKKKNKKKTFHLIDNRKGIGSGSVCVRLRVYVYLKLFLNFDKHPGFSFHVNN